MSPRQVVVIVDGGILSAILQVLTRYSANAPQFPVNDWSLLTGKLGACAPRDEVSTVGVALFTGAQIFAFDLSTRVSFSR
jgi:hypothetical protein